jgi:hypothetical protein
MHRVTGCPVFKKALVSEIKAVPVLMRKPLFMHAGSGFIRKK